MVLRLQSLLLSILGDLASFLGHLNCYVFKWLRCQHVYFPLILRNDVDIGLLQRRKNIDGLVWPFSWDVALRSNTWKVMWGKSFCLHQRHWLRGDFRVDLRLLNHFLSWLRMLASHSQLRYSIATVKIEIVCCESFAVFWRTGVWGQRRYRPGQLVFSFLLATRWRCFDIRRKLIRTT